MKKIFRGLLAFCMLLSIGFSTLKIQAEENKLDEESIALYNSSYESLKNRITSRGYAPTSVSNNGYLGMFVRDSSIQAMAHTAHGDSQLSRKILKFILSIHEELGMDRTGHVLNDFTDEVYGNNYLSTLDTYKNKMKVMHRDIDLYYERQETIELPIVVVNGPNHAGATPFITQYDEIEYVNVYLTKASNEDKVIASIYENIQDENTLLGSTEYTFGDTPNGWQKIEFDTPVKVNPGQQYYLKIQAETNTMGNVLWSGTTFNPGNYLNGWNYDLVNHGGWLEIAPYFLAFIINDDVNTPDISQYPPFTTQTNSEMGIYNINANEHKSAQAFVPDTDTLKGFMVYLTKTYDTDTLKAWITTDINNEAATLAETTYTFNDNSNGWQYLDFDDEVQVKKGQKYYLVLQATAESGAVIWYGTTVAQENYLTSINYNAGQWMELPYYMAFQCVPSLGLNEPKVMAQPFSVRGDYIDYISVDIDAESTGGNILVDIREDYTDASTSLGKTKTVLDRSGINTYEMSFEEDVKLKANKTYYALISVEGNASDVSWVWDSSITGKQSFIYDGTWKDVSLSFKMKIAPEISGEYRIPIMNIDDNQSGIQEIAVLSERLTGVKVMLGKSDDATGKIKATLYKGYGEDAQLIDICEMKVEDIKSEWTTFLFGLPLTKTKNEGNYYLKLETEGCSTGNVIWYGTSLVDNYETKCIEDGKESIVNGEASFDALKSDIRLMSDYTQTDGNYMLIHAWVQYLSNNEGTPEDLLFIKESYPIIQRFANSYLDGDNYNKEMNLIRNPNLEHSRDGRMWNCYDLLTNVFMSQALYELSDVALNMNDDVNAKKWLNASKQLTQGINDAFICEVDGKEIYGELYDIDADMKFIKGMSWVNLAPIAAEWYAMDMEIMQNTYDVFRKYGTTQVYGYEILTDKIDLDAPEPIPNFAGKEVAWEMMFNRLIGDEERLLNIVDMELATSKAMNIDVYPEAWWGETMVTDPGNQEHTSWQVYAMSILFPELCEASLMDVLQDMIYNASLLKKEDYTEATWNVFEIALDNAKQIDCYSPIKDREEAIKILSKAIEELKKLETTDSENIPALPEEDNKPNEDGEGPDSGDSTNVGGLLTLLGLAGIAIAYETRKRMR